MRLGLLLCGIWTFCPSSGCGASLTISIAHTWNGSPLRYGEVGLTNTVGNTLSVTRLAYLVSNVTLRRDDGGSVHFDNQFAYLNPVEQRTSFSLTNVPPGHYTNLAFRVGLDGATNHREPAGWPAGHPLNPIVNGLHWNWRGGYVFLALEGRYRQADRQLGGYVYHLATDPLAMFISVPHVLHVETNAAFTLDFDVARMFNAEEPVRISAEDGADSTHSATDDALARHLAANVTRAFSSTLPPKFDVELAPRLPPSAKPTKGSQAFARRTSELPGLRFGGGSPFPLQLPASFPRPDLPEDNPLTVEGVALGEKLFFDPRLSRDGSQSCASCHQPENAFADRGRALSFGAEGLPGQRNAMPLFNLLWSKAFFWDGRAARLRDQVLQPIQDPREMHESLDRAVAKLAATGANGTGYPTLFAHAFGTTHITAARLGLALEQYLLTLVSGDSKFDRAARGDAQFNDQEKRGLELFVTEYDPARGQFGADCFHCHGGFLFSDYTFKNNGLDREPSDSGRSLVTANAADQGKFKTPSLRNVALTGPYMHDGRFATLEQVIEHYSAGVKRSDTLDPNLAKHPDGGVRLSAEDKNALVAFLKTLTDERFLTNAVPIQKAL